MGINPLMAFNNKVNAKSTTIILTKGIVVLLLSLFTSESARAGCCLGRPGF